MRTDTKKKEESEMSGIPISVCIIAKNEEKYIEECLNRLASYGMEIVVTDTGSTDRTKEIAFNYADKVLDFTWTDDFSAARNYCAENASNDWILALDCDEYVTNIDTIALNKYLKAYPKYWGVLRLKNIVIKPNGEKGYTNDEIPRLYNKKYYFYDKPVHEQLVPRKTSQELPCFLIPMEATHYGYALPPAEMKQKQERNLRLLYHQFADEGESSYICFQIAQSELVLEHYENAILYYEKGLAYGESCDLVYVQYMIEGLAKAYVCAGRPKDGLALMEKYESECSSAKFAYYYANVLMDNNEPLKALIKYVKATTLPDADMLGEELFNCYRHIIELYHRFGEDDLAVFFRKRYEECLQEREQVLNNE